MTLTSARSYTASREYPERGADRRRFLHRIPDCRTNGEIAAALPNPGAARSNARDLTPVGSLSEILDGMDSRIRRGDPWIGHLVVCLRKKIRTGTRQLDPGVVGGRTLRMNPFSILLLDLDQTLYPASNGLWSAVGQRIHDFIVSRTGIESDQVRSLRTQYLDEYGTTLNGLRANFDIDAEDYLEYIHDVPVQDYISPNPDLRSMLQKITSRRVIFTNAHAPHAHRVLNALGIEDLFSDCVDILALEYVNKPQPEAYRRAMEILGDPSPGAYVFVEDRIVNLLPARDLGMTTVLVQDDQSGSEDPLATNGIIQIGKIEDLLTVLPELGR